MAKSIQRLSATAGFVLRMAWRDSRASRGRLLLFAACIVVGVAALAAVGSLGRALERTVEVQAKALLGADLAVGSRVRLTEEHDTFLRTLGGEQSREIAFTTMVVFPGREGTRLAQVRALEGGFPYYGRIETAPPEADERFRREGGALVEESLLLQYGVEVGDEIRIGGLTTRVAGALLKVPGETVVFATLAPRVYLRLSDLEATGLLRHGSLARYRVLFRMPEGTDVEGLVERHRRRFDELRLAHATVEERKEDLGRSMGNLYHFLNLVGLVALLLGGVGIASAIQVHVKQKVPTVAILRCLGCGVWTAFAIYLVQAMALGAIGAGVGAGLGTAIQRWLPRVVADFVPFEIPSTFSWAAVVEAVVLGFAVCVLFALLPLVSVRRVAPLRVLRVAYEGRPRRDGWSYAVAGLLGLSIVLFGVTHARRWIEGVVFTGGVMVAFGVLALVGRGVIAVARRLPTAGWRYECRQGWASLHRPNNRTFLLVVSLGLATFLLLTLQLVQSMLLRELVTGREATRANAILFDVQPDQRSDVAALVREQGLPVLDEAPIINMRLRSIRGRPVEEILSDPDSKGKGWALRREFRSTWSDRLRETETVSSGNWVSRVDAGVEPVPISMEDGIARELGVALGDELVWDVQGVPMRTVVTSLREVDWRRVQPNFFVVFPRGPLDEAPASYVLVTRVGSAADSARLQREVVRRFPNVSAIDLTLVLRTLDDVLGRIGFAIRFMAWFTVATGLLVMVTAILSGRWQRVRESVLLRVLGATRRQVLWILVVEYGALGMLASLTGVALALAAAAALAWWVFEIPFRPSPWPPLAAAGLVTLVTVGSGLLASRGVTRHPPLAILRREE